MSYSSTPSALTIKAIGFTRYLPADDPASLETFETAKPSPTGHDLLVRVHAVSVNPVDTSVRGGGSSGTVLKTPKVIGWDAMGTVEAIGSKVTLFQPGDRVWYAGSFKRPGSNSEFQLVDERIVGHAPKALHNAEAAAMPLTTLTAWEALFEQMGIDPTNHTANAQRTILIINGSGGVGSIATQLAHLAGLKVIATASRPETIDWVKAHGADMSVNHRADLVPQVRALGHRWVDYILELNDLDGHFKEMAELIAPSGTIVSITENHKPVDLKLLTRKRARFAWEWMYTKSFYGTADMVSQHDILERAATLIDNGQLQHTMTRELKGITAANLREAHRLVESGHMMGKVVVSGDFA